LRFPPFDPKKVVTHVYFDNIHDSLVSMYIEAKDMLWTAYEPIKEGIKKIEDMFGGSFTICLQKI
jgi:hypothetical protein